MNSEKANTFLSDHNMGAESIDTATVQASFLKEMENGLAGKPSSLAMIPTYVTIEQPVPADTPVTVIDAGGTNLRVATVTFSSDGEATISDLKMTQMPGIDSCLSKDEFFDCMINEVAPLAEKSDRIGFCFSYPTEITPEVDGKLLHWTKEIQAPDVVGTYIGAEMNEKLARMKCGKRKIVILNDTIATLLAGKSFGQAREYSNYTGVILGTGSNTAYVENNDRILKTPGLPEGAMAVNLESGAFAKAPRTDIDEAFDATTANPGKQMFEKMISGAYLGGVALYTLKTAAQEGLFSKQATGKIDQLKDFECRELDEFMRNPLSSKLLSKPEFSDADLETAMVLCDAVIRRAATFVAINISTPILKTGSGSSPLHPVCITMDGSTFYKTMNLKSLVEQNLREILEARGIYHEMIKVEEAPVIGAAVAGLTI